MKKNITIIITVISALILTVPIVAATEVSLSPSEINVNSEENFNLLIHIDPQGDINYVEKLELKYPADIIQADSFTFSSGWMALSQQGYDFIDNTKGVLIKTAGYPGGFSSVINFGIVSFSAKKEGSGTISVGGNSIAFKINSQSTISGLPASVTITAPTVVTPEPTTTPESTTTTTSVTTEMVQDLDQEPLLDEQTAIDNPNINTQPVNPNVSFIGTISSIITLGTGSAVVAVVVLILIIMVWFYIARPFVKKKNRK
jgi:hypothetical protein